MRTVVLALAALAGLAFVYYAFIRRWMLLWGASPQEWRQTLPGDELILRPRTGSTRAITIHAPVEAVWPWLAQMGQGRGGLYSYDWLENLFGCDIHSSDRVIPELQHVQVGDTVRLVKEGYPVDLAFRVAWVHPPRALVLAPPQSQEDTFERGMAYSTWAFVLERIDGGRTRLISRWRTDFKPGPMAYFWWQFGPLEAVNFVMERKMLKGMRKRAESYAGWRLRDSASGPDQAPLRSRRAGRRGE